MWKFIFVDTDLLLEQVFKDLPWIIRRRTELSFILYLPLIPSFSTYIVYIYNNFHQYKKDIMKFSESVKHIVGGGEIKMGRALQNSVTGVNFCKLKKSFGSHARFAEAYWDISPQQFIHHHCSDVSQTLHAGFFYELIMTAIIGYWWLL